MAQVSNVVEALRYTYMADRVAYLFNEESVAYNILGKVKKSQGGRTNQFLMPILIQNPGAFTGVAEGGSLPSALQPDTTEAYFDLQEYVGLYDVTWKLLQDARNSKFAFQQAIQMLDEGLRRRVIRNLNSDFIDDGRGRLGVLAAADNDTTVTINALPRMEKGMVLDLMDSDDATKNTDSATVTAVDPVNRTVTLSANSGSTGANDYFVIQDTTDSPTCLHTNGLLGIIDSANPPTVVGNYGAINRSTAGNEFWQAVELGNSGTNRPLTEDLMLQAMDYAREKGSGMVKAWISNLAIVRRYHEMLRAEAFFALNSMSPIGGGLGRKSMGDNSASGEGQTPYNFSGVPWHVEPYFAANTIIGLDTDHFFMGVGENEIPRPISEIFDNVPFFRQTTSTTFEVAWYYQCEVLSDNPAAGVKITDVAES